MIESSVKFILEWITFILWVGHFTPGWYTLKNMSGLEIYSNGSCGYSHNASWPPEQHITGLCSWKRSMLVLFFEIWDESAISSITCSHLKFCCENLIAGIAQLAGVCVPFSWYWPKLMCPSMWKRKKKLILMCLLQFECAKRLKAHSWPIPVKVTFHHQ